MINKFSKTAGSWILFFSGIIIVLALIFKGIIPITLSIIEKWIGEIPIEYVNTVKGGISFVSIFIISQICYAFLFKIKKGIKLKNWFIENNRYLFKK